MTVNRQFDDLNTFKKSNSKKNRKNKVRFQDKPMKPKTKPRDHDYHLKAREKKIETNLWDI